MNQDGSLGDVAIVSGGTRGLGRTVVEKLLAGGWRVATFSRAPNEFTEELRRVRPDQFRWEALDVTDGAAIDAYVRQTSQEFDIPRLLVNNAGALHQGLFLTMRRDDVVASIDTNLVGPITLSQACARAMARRRGGVIVNISSINAIRGFKGVAVYAAAKAGLDGFTRALARELGPMNIRVNAVTPGYFQSEMTAGVKEENRERIERRTPLGRLATAGDVADVVLFLTSSAASFITGQSLVVDGGLTC